MAWDKQSRSCYSMCQQRRHRHAPGEFVSERCDIARELGAPADGNVVQANPGGFYGRGAYFAENPAYCDAYFAFTDPDHPQTRRIVLAHVLCGKVKDYGQDVAFDLNYIDGFDSVRGGPHPFASGERIETMMRVVYHMEHVYPQYIVGYELLPSDGDEQKTSN